MGMSPSRSGRQEDVGGVQQIGQLMDGEKAVVELDVVRDSEVDRATLEEEPILLPVQPRHLRVGSPGDEVQHPTAGKPCRVEPIVPDGLAAFGRRPPPDGGSTRLQPIVLQGARA